MPPPIAGHHQLREYFDTVFSGGGFRFAFAQAEEVVTWNLHLAMVKGPIPRRLFCSGRHIGRETDCISALPRGFPAPSADKIRSRRSGLKGGPATLIKPNTCSQMSIVEFADSVYNAYQAPEAGKRNLLR
jgi:hypothetical protein